MEEKKILTKPISQEEFREVATSLADQRHEERVKEFKNYGILSLRNYICVQRYRHIRRAIRRGHVSLYGDMYPRRPFNNRHRGPGTITYERRRVYEQFRNAK